MRLRKSIANSFNAVPVFILSILAGLLPTPPLEAEADVGVNLELYNIAYRGRGDNWYYNIAGMAGLEIESIGNSNMRAEVAIEFQPLDLTPGSKAAFELNLRRLWFKANFPSWRLTVGKTKVAWGNGFVFNAGDVLFGSITPNVDFTRGAVRDDTAWLVAVNIPVGRFVYLEGVLLPPNLLMDEDDVLSFQTIDKTSGGMRFFARVNGWRLETGYLYKSDAKVLQDFLGHRPYFSFHGHAGVDLYGSVSLAAGMDSRISSTDKKRDSWNEIRETVMISLGAFHQFQLGHSHTLAVRLETLLLPWGNWQHARYQDVLDDKVKPYGAFIYPQIQWTIRSAWTLGLQSIISPVDASAQITADVSWNVFQGFTLLGYVVFNGGAGDTLFATNRTGEYWPQDSEGEMMPDQQFNGFLVTLGARYTY